jgi:hypothetical protein
MNEHLLHLTTTPTVDIVNEANSESTQRSARCTTANDTLNPYIADSLSAHARSRYASQVRRMVETVNNCCETYLNLFFLSP